MGKLTEDVAQLLAGVRRSGDFHVSGTLETLAPGLQVEGVGPVALPLLKEQAERLVSVARQAPFGRGSETLVDTDVRRTWQIDSGQVSLTGRTWADTLETIVGRVADGLSVDGQVSAELYKLLLYEEGSFFISHRDSEKRDGMFATLIISLPSVCAGGELVVSHNGREARLDLAVSDPSEVAFAAFYADCPHEVLPVVSGYKLSLIYNLWRADASTRQMPPDHSSERNALAARFRDWSEAGNPEDAEVPDKLVYPLEHAYTQANLSFSMLKGQDAARAAVLAAAAKDAECEGHLALLSMEEWGTAEYSGRYYGRGYEATNDDFEEGEVEERSCELVALQSLDGSDPEFDSLPLDDAELAPPDALDDVDLEVEFHEATGNEGATFERSYQCAAVVVWPRKHALRLLNQGGLDVTLPHLVDLAERWEAAGSGRESPLLAEARELVGLVLDSWPRSDWRAARLGDQVSVLLTTLGRLEDGLGIEAFMRDVSAAGAYAKSHNRSIVAALALLPRPNAEAAIESIVSGNVMRIPWACANLLALASMSEPALAPVAAATSLLEALRNGTAEVEGVVFDRMLRREGPGFVVDLLLGLGHADASLAMEATDVVLSRSGTFPMDAILVPAVVTLSETRITKTDAEAAIKRLAEAVADHLSARVALSLAPPADWKRDADFRCRCQHCSELRRFLADPDRETWSFSSRAENRSHVEWTVRQSHADLDMETLRQGRPHTLVCTKNQASFERRVQQREQDLANLARIDAKWDAIRPISATDQ